jgi:hypothetical protein
MSTGELFTVQVKSYTFNTKITVATKDDFEIVRQMISRVAKSVGCDTDVSVDELDKKIVQMREISELAKGLSDILKEHGAEVPEEAAQQQSRWQKKMDELLAKKQLPDELKEFHGHNSI